MLWLDKNHHDISALVFRSIGLRVLRLNGFYRSAREPKDFSEFSDIEKTCPNGHEIITASRYELVDNVVIKFIPAEAAKEHSNKDPIYRGQYYISISNIEGTEEKVSEKVYWWKEAAEIGQRFDKRTFAEGLKFSDMWKL